MLGKLIITLDGEELNALSISEDDRSKVISIEVQELTASILKWETSGGIKTLELAFPDGRRFGKGVEFVSLIINSVIERAITNATLTVKSVRNNRTK